MFGISLRDRITTIEKRRRMKVMDDVKKIATLKWNWVGQVVRPTNNNKRINHILEWSARS